MDGSHSRVYISSGTVCIAVATSNQGGRVHGRAARNKTRHQTTTRARAGFSTSKPWFLSQLWDAPCYWCNGYSSLVTPVTSSGQRLPKTKNGSFICSSSPRVGKSNISGIKYTRSQKIQHFHIWRRLECSTELSMSNPQLCCGTGGLSVSCVNKVHVV